GLGRHDAVDPPGRVRPGGSLARAGPAHDDELRLDEERRRCPEEERSVSGSSSGSSSSSSSSLLKACLMPSIAPEVLPRAPFSVVSPASSPRSLPPFSYRSRRLVASAKRR